MNKIYLNSHILNCNPLILDIKCSWLATALLLNEKRGGRWATAALNIQKRIKYFLAAGKFRILCINRKSYIDISFALTLQGIRHMIDTITTHLKHNVSATELSSLLDLQQFLQKHFFSSHDKIPIDISRAYLLVEGKMAFLPLLSGYSMFLKNRGKKRNHVLLLLLLLISCIKDRSQCNITSQFQMLNGTAVRLQLIKSSKVSFAACLPSSFSKRNKKLGKRKRERLGRNLFV